MLGYVGQFTPPGQLIHSFPEVEKWMQEEFINKGRKQYQALRSEVYSKNPAMQWTNNLVESFGNMGSTLPLDIISGGVTKAALAGKVLPKVEAILSRIPNFALGSGFRGWVEGVQKPGNVIQKTVSGAVGAAESVAINTAYGTAGVGIKGIGLMTAYGAANTYYEAAKEGRVATKEEVLQGASQGFGFGLIFTLLPHLKEATPIGAEKVSLGKYEAKLKTNLDAGDISKAKITIDEMMKDPTLRKEFKDTFSEILGTKVEKILKGKETLTGEVKVTTELPEGGKVSGVAKEIEAKAIERGLTEAGFDELAEYTPAVKAEQSKKVADLMNTDIELAKRIVTGKEEAPSGLRSEALFTAMKDYAMKTKDGQLALDLAKSPVASEISAAGSKLSLSGMGDPESATSKIREVTKLKEARIEKKLKGKTEKKVKTEIKEALKKKIKEAKPNKYSWETFLNEIRC
jgi:hypothetical protein